MRLEAFRFGFACTICSCDWEAMSPGIFARKGEGLVIIVGVVDSPFGPALRSWPRHGEHMRARLFRRKWHDARNGDLCPPLAWAPFFCEDPALLAGLRCRLHFRRAGGRGREGLRCILDRRAVPDQKCGRAAGLADPRRAMSPTYSGTDRPKQFGTAQKQVAGRWHTR